MRLLFIVLLLLCITPARAQDSLPTPLNADEVFTDAVEVVETLPLLIWDWEQINVYTEDADEWRTYPLPTLPGDTCDVYVSLHDQQSADMVVDPCFETVFDGSSFAAYNWDFNIVTGEFTQTESVCGGLARGRNQTWFFYEPMYGFATLCNTETGMQTERLPEGTIAESDRLFVSYDGAWAVFFGRQLSALTVYSYELATGALNTLGVVPNVNELAAYPWMTDSRHVVVSTRNRTAPTSLYIADVTQAGSLELFYQQPQEPRFNPVRQSYEWFNGGSFDDTPITEANCTFMSYDLETGERHESFLPNICTLGVLLLDGTGDRLMRNTETNELIRYNYYTGESRVIFQGDYSFGTQEISPDGRYLTLQVAVSELSSEVVVVDMLTANTVYTGEVSDNETRIRWLDNQTFLIINLEDGRLITLDDGAFAVTSVGRLQSEFPISQDKRFILLQPNEADLAVYDVTTSQTTLIAQHLAGYSVRANWDWNVTPEHILRIQVENASQSPIAYWRVGVLP